MIADWQCLKCSHMPSVSRKRAYVALPSLQLRLDFSAIYLVPRPVLLLNQCLKMLLIFPVFNRIELLPQFLRYYSLLGITRFVCGLYKGEESPFYGDIMAFQARYDLEIRTSLACSIDAYNARGEKRGLNKIREEFAKDSGWYCIADLDEFHFFRGKSIPHIIQEAESGGYEAVHGVFSDRIALDGSFPELDGRKTLDDTFPLVCDLSKCAGRTCDKIVLAKAFVKIEVGHHTARAKTWRNAAEVHHFKWHKGAYEVLEDFHRRYARQGLRWAKTEYPAVLELMHRSGIKLDNPNLRIQTAPRIGA